MEKIKYYFQDFWIVMFILLVEEEKGVGLYVYFLEVYICVGLTFFSFFLFESLTSLRVHPIQYLLVGAALVLFYLMLLAFSEHLGFTWAYLIASLSCSTLIAVYLSAVLGGWLRGVLFASGLLLLYGVVRPLDTSPAAASATSLPPAQ